MAPTPQPPASVGGFSITRPNFRPRLVASVAGMDKAGKTHFALSAPGPIAYANFDTGLEGVIHKFNKQKPVYSQDYRLSVPPGADLIKIAEAANIVWGKFKSDIREALKSAVIRTLVVDTESHTWELIRLARFGKLTQVMPHQYGPVNTEYHNFINEIYDTDKNLILLGRMKDEWENTVVTVNGQQKEVGRKTGRIERVGYKDLQYAVQLNARMNYDPMAESGNRFSLSVVNCRQNSELSGMVLPEGACDFMTLAQMVYPGTTEKDWS